jgi:hypothetical protein
MHSVVRDSNLRDCYICPSKSLSSRLLCTCEVVRTNSLFSLHCFPFSSHSVLSLFLALCPEHPLRLFCPPIPHPLLPNIPLQRSPVPLLYALKCKAPAEFVQIGIGADNLFRALAGTVKLNRNYRPNKNNSERPAGCHSIRSQADIQVLVLCSNALTSSLFACVLLELRASRCKLRRRMSNRV